MIKEIYLKIIIIRCKEKTEERSTRSLIKRMRQGSIRINYIMYVKKEVYIELQTEVQLTLTQVNLDKVSLGYVK